MHDVPSFPGQADSLNTLASQVVNAGATLSGDWTDITGFGSVDLFMSIVSVSGGEKVFLDWSEDGSTLSYTETYTAAQAGPNHFEAIVPAFLQFFRLRYQNTSGVAETVRSSVFLRPDRLPTTVLDNAWIPDNITRQPAGFYVQAANINGSLVFVPIGGVQKVPPVNVNALGQTTLDAIEIDDTGAQYVHLMSGKVSGLAVKTALVDASVVAGDVTLVAAVAGQRVNVLSIFLNLLAAGGTTFKLTSNAGGTVIFPGIGLNAVGQIVTHAASAGSFLAQTTIGQALVLNASAATSRSCVVTYTQG